MCLSLPYFLDGQYHDGSYRHNPLRVTRDPGWFLVTDFLIKGLMAGATNRYTATRLSAELGLDNRKMRDILTRVNPVQVKGRSKLYLLRDVIPHAVKYLGAPDVIDLNVERARKP